MSAGLPPQALLRILPVFDLRQIKDSRGTPLLCKFITCVRNDKESIPLMNSKQRWIIQPDNVYRRFLRRVETVKGQEWYHNWGVKPRWLHKNKPQCIMLLCGCNRAIHNLSPTVRGTETASTKACHWQSALCNVVKVNVLVRKWRNSRYSLFTHKDIYSATSKTVDSYKVNKPYRMKERLRDTLIITE
jgi:hypothetical protein